jgi:hypothetical protein
VAEGKLSFEQIRFLTGMIEGPGWREVALPLIKTRYQTIANTILDHNTDDRTGQFLKGRAAELDFIVGIWEKLIKEAIASQAEKSSTPQEQPSAVADPYAPEANPAATAPPESAA